MRGEPGSAPRENLSPPAQPVPILRPSHPTGELREASWAGGDCGFRVPSRCGLVRRGGADFAQAEQAGLRPRRAYKRSGPPDTRARSRAARGRRCPTQSTSTRHRHAAVDCERRPAPRIPGCSGPKPRRPSLDGAFGHHVTSRNITPDTRRQGRPGRHFSAHARRCRAARGRRALRRQIGLRAL